MLDRCSQDEQYGIDASALLVPSESSVTYMHLACEFHGFERGVVM
jgi:hypothetical protein